MVKLPLRLDQILVIDTDGTHSRASVVEVTGHLIVTARVRGEIEERACLGHRSIAGAGVARWIWDEEL